MQLPPLTFTEVSFLLAAFGIILLVMTELSSPLYELAYLTVNKKNLGNAALVTGALFLATVVIWVISIILGT